MNKKVFTTTTATMFVLLAGILAMTTPANVVHAQQFHGKGQSHNGGHNGGHSHGKGKGGHYGHPNNYGHKGGHDHDGHGHDGHDHDGHDHCYYSWYHGHKYLHCYGSSHHDHDNHDDN
jgi:ribonuclease E